VKYVSGITRESAERTTAKCYVYLHFFVITVTISYKISTKEQLKILRRISMLDVHVNFR